MTLELTTRLNMNLILILNTMVWEAHCKRYIQSHTVPLISTGTKQCTSWVLRLTVAIFLDLMSAAGRRSQG